MNYDLNKHLRPYRNIRTMLKGIPRRLWYIFLPESIAELFQLEASILSFRAREIDRNKVMSIQKTFHFPLHPNVPLREMVARLKIQKLKGKNFGPDDDDDGQEAE